MSDFVIDDTAIHFSASKNLEYRQRVKQRFECLIDFLESNSLTTHKLSSKKDKDGNIKIMKSDLNEIGFEVIHKGYDKWLKGIERGKSPTDLNVLENELKNILKNKKISRK